ncbi:MAG: hypothetical protein ACJA14_001404 [Ilumatobacter sp.]|jgi:hypothetical protein
MAHQRQTQHTQPAALEEHLANAHFECGRRPRRRVIIQPVGRQSVTRCDGLDRVTQRVIVLTNRVDVFGRVTETVPCEQ